MNNTLIDLTGKRFDKLLVIYKAPNRKSPSGTTITRWHCVCDCGNELDVDAYALRCGNTKSCGCNKHKSQTTDISGRRFGLLTVQCLDHIDKARTYWKCICDCGNYTVVSKSNLLNNNTKSCGCLVSTGESEIEHVLSKYHINFEKQAMFADCCSKSGNPFRFDFAIKSNDQIICLIEFQGKQHYQTNTKFGKYQREYSDNIKKSWCKTNHYKLYEIRYDDNVESFILAILCFHKLIPCQASCEEGVTTIPQGSSFQV